MANNYYNIVAKPHKDCDYIYVDMIATKLSEKQFNRVKELNPSLLGDYVFVPYSQTDFTWWSSIKKYLTQRRLSSAYFSIDYWGRITKY